VTNRVRTLYSKRQGTGFRLIWKQQPVRSRYTPRSKKKTTAPNPVHGQPRGPSRGTGIMQNTSRGTPPHGLRAHRMHRGPVQQRQEHETSTRPKRKKNPEKKQDK